MLGILIGRFSKISNRGLSIVGNPSPTNGNDCRISNELNKALKKIVYFSAKNYVRA